MLGLRSEAKRNFFPKLSVREGCSSSGSDSSDGSARLVFVAFEGMPVISVCFTEEAKQASCGLCILRLLCRAHQIRQTRPAAAAGAARGSRKEDEKSNDSNMNSNNMAVHRASWQVAISRTVKTGQLRLQEVMSNGTGRSPVTGRRFGCP